MICTASTANHPNRNIDIFKKNSIYIVCIAVGDPVIKGGGLENQL